MKDGDRFTAGEFISRLVDVADNFGRQAGVGGMETAGAVVSYLAENPDWLGAFMKGGVSALPDDFFLRGCLTWHDAGGQVRAPVEARNARTARSLMNAALAAAAEDKATGRDQ